jgi:hypothetical protein
MEQSHRFLSDLDSGVDFRPSGLLPDNLNLSPHHPTFDSFDLRPSSPHFPGTPSYNGSYHNSPYSAVSELDFDSKDDSLGLFDSDLAIPPREDYDPSKYDAPASTGLLMFEDAFMSGVNNSNRVSVSVTPADDAHSPAYYDHGSPSSSNGGGESGAENGRRSPASSVSSHLGITASPHLDFNQLHVESPYHRPIPIPNEGASPQMKAQSPPFLVIPDLNQPSGYQQEQPVIHAPEGDGAGPRLHIVPATPVSGGGETAQAGFRNAVSQGPYSWVCPATCFAEEFVYSVFSRSQDQQIHQLCHRRVGPIIQPTPRQTPQHHSRRLSSAPEPDPPALPASHLTSPPKDNPTAIRPSTQLPPKATITFCPLLLPVLVLNPTPLLVHRSGIPTRSTTPHPRVSILTRARLTLAVAGLCK